MTRWTVCLGVEFRDAGEESVVYDTRNGRIHILNATASKAFKACLDGCSSEHISACLARDFGINSERCAQDTNKILDAFERLGLIQTEQVTERA